MSLIDIHIQSEEFPPQIDFYDEMNVQLANDDYIQSRCGEIFISQRRVLIFVCTECKENFCSYDDFFMHLCEQHTPNEVNVKYEPTEEEDEGELTADDNFIVLMDQDDEELNVKPSIDHTTSKTEATSNDQDTETETIEVEAATDEAFSQEILETFETIDEYEALDESEENKTVTFLNDFSKFLEKDKESIVAVDAVHRVTESRVESSAIDKFVTESKVSAGAAAAAAAIACTAATTSLSFECEKCHKGFQSEAKLRTHRKHHDKERNFKCTICGFAFTEEFNLRAHLRRHNGVKPYACEQCGKRFTTRNEVKAHTRSHTGERPYICEICGQAYVTSGSLNEHKKRHTNYRPHKCQLCGKTFFDSGLLKEHIVMHTGERKHVCDVCEASFTRRKALLQHMKLHSGVKQYKCNFCDKAFAQKPGLASHLKTHRNILKVVKRETLSPNELDIRS